MSADVIAFPVVRIEREPGSTARDALIVHAMDLTGATLADAESWADFTLAALWSRGFKMVPVE